MNLWSIVCVCLALVACVFAHSLKCATGGLAEFGINSNFARLEHIYFARHPWSKSVDFAFVDSTIENMF